MKLTRRGILALFGGAVAAGAAGIYVSDKPVMSPSEKAIVKHGLLTPNEVRKSETLGSRGVRVRLLSFEYTVGDSDSVDYKLQVQTNNYDVTVEFCSPVADGRPKWLYDKEIYIDFAFPEDGPRMYINGKYYKACSIVQEPRPIDIINITSWHGDGIKHSTRGL